MSDKQIDDLVDLIFDTDMEELLKEKSTLEYIHKLQQENKQLKKEIKKLKKSKPYKILKEWEEFIKNKEFNNYTDFEYKMKLIELKEKYK